MTKENSDRFEFNIPNIMSIFRVLLALFAFLEYSHNGNRLEFFILTIIVISLDGLDGIIARKFNQCTVFGAKLDIICDRLVELFYWLYFGIIGLTHIWVFYFFLIRGLLVDYLSKDSNNPLGDSFLRSSRFMRLSYGFLKLASFSLLILMPHYAVGIDIPIAELVVYLTVLVCLLRAVPTLQDSLRK